MRVGLADKVCGVWMSTTKRLNIDRILAQLIKIVQQNIFSLTLNFGTMSILRMVNT